MSAGFDTTEPGNCGGGIIRRTDTRISYIRLLDFERMRVEMFANREASAERPAVAHGFADRLLDPFRAWGV